MLKNFIQTQKNGLLKKSIPNNRSFLRVLRERRQVSRHELSRRTHLSSYQVEGLEGKGTEDVLLRLLTCVKALGYRVNDLLDLIYLNHQNGVYSKGILGKPLSETILEEGVRSQSYIEEESIFMCQVQLAVGKKINRDRLSSAGTVLVIVREGVLLLDLLTNQSSYKKDQFFILRDNVPFEFSNPEPYTQTCILLFVFRHLANRTVT